MIQYLMIWIVFNNLSTTIDLTSGWGFSAWIESDTTSILFDTGSDGKILLDNMKKLKLDPADLELIVISHPHWDHTGGLEELAKNIKPSIPVFVPETAFPELSKEFPTLDLVSVSDKIELGDNLYSSGEMKVQYFDHILPEQALFIDTSEGLIVITGCAHPGIENIVSRAKELFPDRAIQLVTGGFHLGSSTKYQIEKCIETLQRFGVKKVAPSHCTGNLAIEMFKTSWQDNYLDLSLGKKFELKK